MECVKLLPRNHEGAGRVAPAASPLDGAKTRDIDTPDMAKCVENLPFIRLDSHLERACLSLIEGLQNAR